MLMLAVTLLAGVFATTARADVPAAGDFSPMIWSDKGIYSPGEEVFLSGAHWQPGESVHVSVNDDQSSSWSRSVDVTADDAGSIADRFTLPGWFVAHYKVTATGASGVVATTAFDDDSASIIFPADASSQSTSTWSANGISGDTNGSNTVSARISIKRPDGLYWNGTAWNGTTENLRPVTLVAVQGQRQTWTYPFAAANHSLAGSYVVNVHSYSAANGTGSELATATSTYTWNLACTAPSVTAQPGNASITYGADATFTVAASGTPAPTIQWQRSTDGINWTDVANATSSSLTVAKPFVSQSGDQYRAQVSNSCGTANSAAATLTVAKRQVTGAFTAANKQYDATAAASIGDRSLTGAVIGDAVSLNGGSATFADKNVGAGKTVTGTGFSLTGTDAGNYTLGSTTLTTTASITKKDVSGSFTAADRQYDGTTAATVTGRSLSGALAGDAVSLSGGTASFATPGVGSAKTVTLSGATLSGGDAGNYNLTGVGTTTASISKKDVSGGFTAADRQYDGTTAATVLTRSVTGRVGTEDVSLSGGTASFATPGVGSAKTVTLSGATLSGGDAGNYNLTSVATATASIAPKQVTGSFTAQNKVYNGSTAAVIVGGSVATKVSGDDVDLDTSAATADFATAAAGTGKTVTGSGFKLKGADAGNYQLASTSLTTTADITKKELTGSFTAQDKVYNGSTAAVIAADSTRLSGIEGSDQVTLTGADAQFTTATAGLGKTVTLKDAGLAGADSGNYTLKTPVTTTATITKKDVRGSFTANDKVYDGDVSAEVTGRSLTGVIGEDAVTLSGGTAKFLTKNALADKTVTLTGATLTGTDAGNYTLTGVEDAKATITERPTTGSWGAANKTYDGTRAATVTGETVNNKVPGDNVALSGGTATFDTKDVGTGKTVTGTGFALSGGDAGNYDLTSVNAATTANIVAKTLTGVITVADKVFDTTTAATVTSRGVTGKIGTEDVTLTGGTAAFDSAQPGVRTATLTGGVLGGTDKGNYVLSGNPITATATISTWAFKGFFAPIDVKSSTGAWVYNTAKAGSAIPVKFSLGGDRGLNVFASGFPKTTTVACPTAPATDVIEELAAGTTSGLKYDATVDQYNYIWKTATTLAGKCVRLDVQFIDGQTQQAYFNLTK